MSYAYLYYIKKKKDFVKPFLFLHSCFHSAGSVLLSAFSGSTGIYMLEMYRYST